MATLDEREAYEDADFAIIATPTNYDPQKNFFDTSSVEAAITAVRAVNKSAWIVIKSTIPVGYTQKLSQRLNDCRIIFSGLSLISVGTAKKLPLTVRRRAAGLLPYPAPHQLQAV